MREIKKRYKKIVALVLCLGMMTGIFEGVPGLGECSVVAEAAGNGVQKKIDELKNMYPAGTHFTVNGQACGHSDEYTCSNCRLSKIIAARHPEFKNNNLTDAWTCYAFARFSYYYLFGINAAKASISKYATKVSIDNAQLGDYVICSSGHVGIFLYSSYGKYYLYESDYNYTPNLVSYGAYAYSASEITEVWHANNYDSVNGGATGSSIQTQSPSINQDLSETKYNYIQETTFGRKAVFRNPSGRQIEDLGMVLYDENGKEITRNHEGTHSSGVGSYKQESFIYEDVTKDLGIVLEPETNYFYQFFIKVAGSDLVYSDRYSIQTGGKKTPNTPSISIDKTHVAAGDSVTVTWQADVAAVNGYDITVVSEDGTYKRTITVNDKNAFSASVSVPNVGTYRIMAVAKGKSKK